MAKPKYEPSPIMEHFAFDHLPANLQEVSKPIGNLARRMDRALPACAEKSAGCGSCSRPRTAWSGPNAREGNRMSDQPKGFWTKLMEGISAKPMVFGAGVGVGILIAVALRISF